MIIYKKYIYDKMSLYNLWCINNRFNFLHFYGWWFFAWKVQVQDFWYLSYGYKHLTLFCIVFGYLYTKYIKVYRDNIKNKFYCLILFNQIKNIFLINISVSTYISSHTISINFHLLISFTFNIHIRFNDKNNL